MLYLKRLDIAYIACLTINGLGEKSIRQKWPSLPGKPIILYDINTLPDDIQIAWASWSEEKYQEAINKEMERGVKARTDRVPPPITSGQAKEAITWPVRNSYFVTGKKVYDGESKGLCPAARKILLERFGEGGVPGKSYSTNQDRNIFVFEESALGGDGKQSECQNCSMLERLIREKEERILEKEKRIELLEKSLKREEETVSSLWKDIESLLHIEEELKKELESLKKDRTDSDSA